MKIILSFACAVKVSFEEEVVEEPRHSVHQQPGVRGRDCHLPQLGGLSGNPGQ